MRQRVQSSQVFPDLPRTHRLAFSRIDYNHGSQRESGSKVGSATSFLWVHGHPETSLGSSVNRDDSRACITGELNEIMLIPLMLIVFLLSFFIMTLLCVYIFLGSLFSLQIPKEQKLTLSFLYPMTTLNLTWPCGENREINHFFVFQKQITASNHCFKYGSDQTHGYPLWVMANYNKARQRPSDPLSLPHKLWAKLVCPHWWIGNKMLVKQILVKILSFPQAELQSPSAWAGLQPLLNSLSLEWASPSRKHSRLCCQTIPFHSPLFSTPSFQPHIPLSVLTL